MSKINLRDYYPFYKTDFFVDVHDEVEAALLETEWLEQNYIRRRFYNKAHYSLDAGDVIVNNRLFVPLSPCEVYERKVTYEQLHAAIASLPDKQAIRIYAHFFLNMSKAAIAEAEGVSEKAVRVAIERGLEQIKEVLKTIL